jgi:DNA-binding NarL/FixJ family response regulator
MDLTRRELEIADLISIGLRNKEIAFELGLSTGTVKMHLHNIYHKLNISGRLQLAVAVHESNAELEAES